MRATTNSKERMKAYYKKNREKFLKRAKERYDPVVKKVYNQKYIKANKEKLREAGKKYYVSNKEEIKRKNDKYRKENPEVARKYEKKRNKRDREKTICRRQLNEAIRTGKIIRGSCVVCRKLDAQAHHEDYTKPLEVVWLCPQHHSDLHRKYALKE